MYDESEDLSNLEDDIVIMYDDEDNKVEFKIIDSLEYGDINYLLLIDAQNIEDEECEAVLFKVVSENDDDFFYEQVEEDEEFNKIIKFFKLDNTDYEIDL